MFTPKPVYRVELAAVNGVTCLRIPGLPIVAVPLTQGRPWTSRHYDLIDLDANEYVCQLRGCSETTHWLCGAARARDVPSNVDFETELTPEGEQFVIPGCKVKVADLPCGRQANLFDNE